MPDGYGGFDWGTAHYCMAPTAASGNTTYVALSSTTAWIRRSDGTPLYFINGATYWSRRGLDATGDFCFALHLKGKTVYNGLADKKGGRMRFTGTPTLLKPNDTGPIDMIALAFDRNGRDWNPLAFDNFGFALK